MQLSSASAYTPDGRGCWFLLHDFCGILRYEWISLSLNDRLTLPWASTSPDPGTQQRDGWNLSQLTIIHIISFFSPQFVWFILSVICSFLFSLSLWFCAFYCHFSGFSGESRGTLLCSICMINWKLIVICLIPFSLLHIYLADYGISRKRTMTSSCKRYSTLLLNKGI